MLFDSLDKIRKNSIMSSILIATLGIIILICQNEYIGSLILVLGYTLEVVSIVMMLSRRIFCITYSLSTLSRGKTKVNIEFTGYNEPLERIGNYIKYVVTAFITCVLFIGSCILATVDLTPKTSTGIPLIAMIGIVFSISLAIYSVIKLTKK